MKRVFSLFLSVLMLTGVLAAVDLSAYATTVDSGTCGTKVTWSLNSSGTLTISGKGNMTNYSAGAPWWNNFDYYSIKKVVIKSGVTSIGERAFDSCYNLTSVTIPNSVKSIGSKAFYNCSSLTSVSIPGSVTSIGDSAFTYCESLTSITIPNSVKSIGDYAFDHCTSLESVIISSSVTSIGDYVFCWCYSIKNVAIPNGVTSIGNYSFYECYGLRTITIPDSVKSIDTFAFEGCSRLEDVYYTGSESAWNKISFDTSWGNTNNYLLYATFHYNHSHTYKVTKATTDKNGSKKCSVCGAKTIIYKPKTVSLSTTSYTYNGKAKKPTVKVKNSVGGTISSKNYTVSYINQSTGKTVSSMKNPGKYYVKVKFKGSSYSGALKTSLKIKPKKTSIKSITASSKGFTVKWGKVSTQNTGYQVQYSTSKSFKSAKTATISKTGTTSKKVTKLKAKKKYYVRVRTYKTVKINGKNTKIYSSWSSVKGVTTK